MEDTWGISGPDFISLYLLAVLISLLFAFAVRILTRSGAVTTTAPEALATLEVACLTGGPRRVVEAAVAQLVDTGQLRPARNGYVTCTNLSEPRNDVERTVLHEVKKHGSRSIALLTERLSSSAVVKDVDDRLVRAGYLVDGKDAERRKVLGMVPIILVLIVGIFRWLAGLSNDKPIGVLTLLLLGTGLIIYAMRRQNVNRRTFQGARACSSAACDSAAGSVAAKGLRNYPDVRVREALLAGPGLAGTAAASGSTGWWGTSTPGGTGCGSAGGGSSCGGGGGGCGG